MFFSFFSNLLNNAVDNLLEFLYNEGRICEVWIFASSTEFAALRGG